MPLKAVYLATETLRYISDNKMHPEDVCEVYILYLIDELDAGTDKRFMDKLEKMNAPYSSIKEFIQEYEREEAISVALIDWIKDEWKSTQLKKKKLTANQFAKKNASNVLASLS